MDIKHKLAKLFELDTSTYKQIADCMGRSMVEGLQCDSSTLKMLPTFVSDLPNGTETGKFLALDLGGTNFRILLLILKDSEKPEKFKKEYTIPKDLMTSEGEMLFDHIADCLISFVVEFKLMDSYLPLGFTFSFPCEQTSLSSGYLIKWTKGFCCPGVEGEDVVNLLRQALHRKQYFNVGIVALINDTVGCLLSCAYHHADCQIAVILGTGTNACYVEKCSNITKLKHDEKPQDGGNHQHCKGDIETASNPTGDQMVINTEWCSFGDNGELDSVRTEFDRLLDKETINSGFHIFEKMVSGMYLGELVRLVLVDLIRNDAIFEDRVQLDAPIFHKDSLPSECLSIIESSRGDVSITATAKILDDLGVSQATELECDLVRHLCQLVSSRAAHLAAAGVATLVNHINDDFVTIAVDGSLYRKHPSFAERMVAQINLLVQPHLIDKFQLKLSDDGSGVGAALAAAVAYKYRYK